MNFAKIINPQKSAGQAFLPVRYIFAVKYYVY